MMLPGIEILSQTTVEVHPGWTFILIIAGVFLALIGFWADMPIMGCIGLFLLAIGVIGALWLPPADTYEKYKVLVSDEVLLNEFHSLYDILDVDGKIYTIKLK